MVFVNALDWGVLCQYYQNESLKKRWCILAKYYLDWSLTWKKELDIKSIVLLSQTLNNATAKLSHKTT